MNPQEYVWKNLYSINTRTILQEKRQLTATLQFGTRIDSYASSHEDSTVKATVDEEKENLEKFPAWNPTKVRSKLQSDRWSKDEGRKSSFRLICHLKEYRTGDKVSKIQRWSYIPKWHCERWFGIFCSFHRTRIISITNDSSQSHGYHLQTARLRWTSSRRSICLNPSKNGRYSQIIENSQIGVSRHLDSSTTTQMAKIMVQHGRPSRSSRAKSVRSFFAGL